MLVALVALPPTTSARPPTRRRCSASCGSCRSTWSAVLVFGVRRAAGPSAAGSRPALTLGGVLETIFGGLVGLDGPYTYAVAVLRRVLPGRAAGAGRRRAWSCSSVLLFRPLVARHRAHRGRLGARHAPRAHLRLGHAGLLRAARRQELLLLPRRRGVHRLHLHRRLRPGRPATRSARRESVVAVLDEFLAMCDERAWTPALLAVREASMPLYAVAWLLARFYLGDEAIIDCRPVHPRGRARAKSAARRPCAGSGAPTASR